MSFSSSSPPLAYQDLNARFQRLSCLEGASGILHWDSAVMMPEGGASDRADQLAVLAGVRHDLLTRADTGDWLDEAEAGLDALDSWQQANLAEMRRLYNHAIAVPGDLVEALTRACATCEKIWRKARADNDFTLTVDPLKTQLSLIRQSAQAKGEALGLSPYDALIDEYSPGFSWEEIKTLFADLTDFLPPFLERVLKTQGKKPVFEGPFKPEAQARLARSLMERIGFDFTHGRLDISTHPFCGGTADDVRITTRYDEEDFLPTIMAVIHETGHGLYERGLPPAWRNQPVGRALGMAVHESQSLLLEMQACRTREFFQFAAPLFHQEFVAEGSGWNAESFYRRTVFVDPGFIRVDADEVTYPLHIILRTRLERALIAGDLAVEDLPDAWTHHVKDLLGLDVPDNRQGCLQDIHWFDGAWGYFPSYTLGALMAAQMYDAAVRAIPSIPSSLAQGNFTPLLGWLRSHIHGKASSLPAQTLLIEATGKPLGTEVFKAHLTRRYLGS